MRWRGLPSVRRGGLRPTASVVDMKQPLDEAGTEPRPGNCSTHGRGGEGTEGAVEGGEGEGDGRAVAVNARVSVEMGKGSAVSPP